MKYDNLVEVSSVNLYQMDYSNMVNELKVLPFVRIIIALNKVSLVKHNNPVEFVIQQDSYVE